MSRFLAKVTNDNQWTEVTLQNEHEMNVFVGGRADVIPLSMGIDLHLNDGLITELENLPLNLFLSFDDDVHPVYGNVFVAGRDECGDPIPLTREQKKHLDATFHVMTMPCGLKIMHLHPGGFHCKMIEPLRILGEALGESI